MLNQPNCLNVLKMLTILGTSGIPKMPDVLKRLIRLKALEVVKVLKVLTVLKVLNVLSERTGCVEGAGCAEGAGFAYPTKRSERPSIHLLPPPTRPRSSTCNLSYPLPPLHISPIPHPLLSLFSNPTLLPPCLVFHTTSRFGNPFILIARIRWVIHKSDALRPFETNFLVSQNVLASAPEGFEAG